MTVMNSSATVAIAIIIMDCKNGSTQDHACAFYLQNTFNRLSVPMHGIVLQMLVFIPSNCSMEDSQQLYVVTVLLEYFTDCSIIIIIIKLFKGIHKRHVHVQGDTFTYNLYSYKNTITNTEQHTQYKYRIKQSH